MAYIWYEYLDLPVWIEFLCMEWRSTAAASKNPVTRSCLEHLIKETTCAITATELAWLVDTTTPPSRPIVNGPDGLLSLKLDSPSKYRANRITFTPTQIPTKTKPITDIRRGATRIRPNFDVGILYNMSTIILPH
mmetsp:Transcript_59112/g.116280  ORF Transcript_59112/g.116280 Transcript_59112/m.116280 type:complete len:135 (-) Transcript_59112:83-487(-)